MPSTTTTGARHESNKKKNKIHIFTINIRMCHYMYLIAVIDFFLSNEIEKTKQTNKIFIVIIHTPTPILFFFFTEPKKNKFPYHLNVKVVVVGFFLFAVIQIFSFLSTNSYYYHHFDSLLPENCIIGYASFVVGNVYNFYISS